MPLQAIRELAERQGMTFTETRDGFTLEKVLAERKAFLSRKKLRYCARARLVETAGELLFSECLKESGLGLSSGDDDLSPGFSFKKESYQTGGGPREGKIEEQSRLFGKDYSYTFDFADFRRMVEAATRDAGYTFTWKFSL